MITVDVSKFVRVEKDSGVVGSLKVTSEPKMVKVRLRVQKIPEGGGVITMFLPWGKIYGVTKSANGGS